jgi:hypothetical protein
VGAVAVVAVVVAGFFVDVDVSVGFGVEVEGVGDGVVVEVRVTGGEACLDEPSAADVAAALFVVLLVSAPLHGCVPASVAPTTSSTTAAIHQVLFLAPSAPCRGSVPWSRLCLM